MKKSKITVLISIMLSIWMLQGCIALPTEEGTDPADGGKRPAVLTHYLTATYSYDADEIDEGSLCTRHAPAYLMLMNKVQALDESYEPSSLVRLTCPVFGDKELYLERRAADALAQMLREMKADGVNDIMVTSAYRSYEYQSSLHSFYLQQESETISQGAIDFFGEAYIRETYWEKGLYTLSSDDARVLVESYSAPPGKSEHQTGLCIDFITSGMGGELTTAFESTVAFAWLAENAHSFGFILRYPKGKEDVTGYTYEPWHYRYVGREAATNIYYSGLTLEEYLEIYYHYS